MTKKNKSLLRYAVVPITLLLELSLISSWLTPAQALTFRPPGNLAPKRSIGGASRDQGKCFAKTTNTKATLTPLMPTTNNGLTMAERPTFFVYVPQNSAKEVFFSVQGEDSDYYYQTTFRLPKNPGAIGFKLPLAAPALQIGKNYKWSVVMVCDRQLEPDDPAVSGWIRRVKPSSNLVQTPASVEIASVLANAGIWYDTLSTLAQLKRSQPQNPTITANWQQLLKSVGLDAIAKEPLINY